MTAVNTPGPLIDYDLHCVTCGYNLRTLPFGGTCPECASSVDSTFGYNLYCADLRWVRRMRLGTVAMLIADLCLLGFVTIYFGGLVLPRFLPYGGLVLLILAGASLACWTIGVWRITTLQPAVRNRNFLRRVTRVIGSSGLLLCLLLLTCFFTSASRRWFIPVLAISAYVLAFLSPMVVCIYCRPLGRRGQQGWLSRLNRVLAVLFGVGLAAIVSLLVLEMGFGVSLVYDHVWFALSPFLLMGACDIAGAVGLIGHWRLFGRVIRVGSHPPPTRAATQPGQQVHS